MAYAVDGGAVDPLEESRARGFRVLAERPQGGPCTQRWKEVRASIGRAKPVARGLRPTARSGTIRNVMIRKFPALKRSWPYRSKFNVALGVEAQGFCALPRRGGA
jgi:hypothetical protein